MTVYTHFFLSSPSLCVCACAHTYVPVCISVYMFVCVYLCICLCVCVWVHLCLWVYLRICFSVSMCLCVCASPAFLWLPSLRLGHCADGGLCPIWPDRLSGFQPLLTTQSHLCVPALGSCCVLDAAASCSSAPVHFKVHFKRAAPLHAPSTERPSHQEARSNAVFGTFYFQLSQALCGFMYHMLGTKCSKSFFVPPMPK